MVKTRKNMYKNNLNTIVFIVLILGNITGFAQSAPVVSNVTFAQRTDGSLKVDVYYDVYDADGDTLVIAMYASSNYGSTWDMICNSKIGDHGENIIQGQGKHVIWNFGQEHPNYYNEGIRIKIVASDVKRECPGLPFVSYEGKTYRTVQIGAQCWLRDNLNIGKQIINSQNAQNNLIIEKYCFGDDSVNCEIYGGLYQWREAMDYSTLTRAKGICPTGWHIPTIEEFQQLRYFVNENSNALKEIGQGTGTGIGTNTSGFSALLIGYRGSGGGFGNYWQGHATHCFWTSSATEVNWAYFFELNIDRNFIGWDDDSGNYGFSIRCLKD